MGLQIQGVGRNAKQRALPPAEKARRRVRKVLTKAANSSEDGSRDSDDAEDTDEGLQVAAWWGDGLAGTMRAKGNVVCCKRRETRESVVSTLF